MFIIFRKLLTTVPCSFFGQSSLLELKLKVKVLQLRVDEKLVRIIIIMRCRCTRIDSTEAVGYFALN